MAKISGYGLVVILLAAGAWAQMPASQPPLWNAKPDVPAFEKVENEHLAAAQRSLDALIAIKGKRTIETP